MCKKLSELNLSDDFLFAKVMTDSTICKEFLEKLLGIKIKKVTIPEDQKTINLLLESKGIRLDIYVQDEHNTVYNVEMQRSSNKNLPKRLRYYQGNIDLDFINKGEDYINLVKTYIIFICTFDPFKGGRHRYTFENTCVEDNSIKLRDETQKIILSTKGKINDLDEEILEFLRYVEASNDKTVEESKGDLVKHIHRKVENVKNDVTMEVEFMTLLQRDKEKIEEGREEGDLKRAKIGIRNMLQKNIDIKSISELLEVDISLIEEVKRELKKKSDGIK
ncbi:MAG: Rpn family recombination-promoting nuclease/putative transposase [Clostridium sp.]